MKLLLAIGVTVFLFAPVIQGKFDENNRLDITKLKTFIR